MPENPVRLLCLVLFMAPLLTARADDHDRIRALVEAGRILPLERILARARKRRAGRVLETELETRAGRFVYEVEILDARGFVRELIFDAETGAFLKEEQED